MAESVRRPDPLGREEYHHPVSMGEAPTLDGQAETPDVVDGAYWLSLPRAQAMALVGLSDEAAYARVYKDIEAAVYPAENRGAQGGVRVSIRLAKRRSLRQGHLIRLPGHGA